MTVVQRASSSDAWTVRHRGGEGNPGARPKVSHRHLDCHNTPFPVRLASAA